MPIKTYFLRLKAWDDSGFFIILWYHVLMRFEKGNALLYVLIGVGLFAMLSYTLSRNVDVGSTTISAEQVDLKANELINHAQQVSQAIQQMLMTGSRIEDIDFVLPTDAAFNTPPNLNKIFHPSGGGINVFNGQDLELYSVPNPFGPGIGGWQSMTATNVEWTPTSAVDIIYTFGKVAPEICSKINKILIGDPTIPGTTVGWSNTFVEGAGSNNNFVKADCATCDGKYNYCIQQTAYPNNYMFYNIVASQ